MKLCVKKKKSNYVASWIGICCFIIMHVIVISLSNSKVSLSNYYVSISMISCKQGGCTVKVSTDIHKCQAHLTKLPDISSKQYIHEMIFFSFKDYKKFATL